MDKQTAIARIKELLPTYKANPNVLAQLSSINLLAVVGPTGAGKSTVARRSGIPYVIGDTTRAPRQGEMQGIDYNFRSDFTALLKEVEDGEFVQLVLQRETEIYGTKASSYPASGACAMSVLARVLPEFKQFGFASVIPVYVVPPSHTEWMRRISVHRDKDLEARLVEAKESLQVALNDSTYVFILNDDLNTAVADMQNVAKGTTNQTASARARNAAIALYEQLQRTIR